MRGVHRQRENVLEPPIVDAHIELDMSTLYVTCPHHRTLGDDGRLPKRGFHTIEKRIPVGAVHDGIECRGQRQRLACEVNRKVGCLRAAGNLDTLEDPFVAAVG